MIRKALRALSELSGLWFRTQLSYLQIHCQACSTRKYQRLSAASKETRGHMLLDVHSLPLHPEHIHQSQWLHCSLIRQPARHMPNCQLSIRRTLPTERRHHRNCRVDERFLDDSL